MELQKSMCPEQDSRSVNLGRPYVKFLATKRLVKGGVSTPTQQEVVIRLEMYQYSLEACIERIKKLLSRKWTLISYGNFPQTKTFAEVKKFIRSQYNPMLIEDSPERLALKDKLKAELMEELSNTPKRAYNRKEVSLDAE